MPNKSISIRECMIMSCTVNQASTCGCIGINGLLLATRKFAERPAFGGLYVLLSFANNEKISSTYALYTESVLIISFIVELLLKSKFRSSFLKERNL